MRISDWSSDVCSSDLTRAGNDYIYDEIVKYVDALHKNDPVTGTSKPMDNALASDHLSFREANALYRSQEFEKSLSAYVRLARTHKDFSLYKRCAVDAFLRARDQGLDCTQDDIVYVRSLLN